MAKMAEPLKLPKDWDPLQWTTLKKARLLASTCVSTLSLTYTSSSYVSSVPYVIERYGASREVAILGVSLFVLGFGLGPFCFGPTSDVIGRRWIYVFTYICFSAFSWGCVYAPNVTSLLIFRFLAGVFGSSSLNNTPATIADASVTAYVSSSTYYRAICAFSGPGAGPLLGGFVAYRTSGKWNLFVNAVFVSVCAIWLFLDCPETHVPTLLVQYEKTLDPEQAAQLPPKKDRGSLVKKYRTAIVRPFYLLATEPVLLFVSLYLSFLYALIYGLFTVFPIIFEEVRGFSQEDFALTYFGLLLGFSIASLSIYWPISLYYAKKAKEASPKRADPSARFIGMFYTFWMVPLAFLLVATTSYRNVHWFGDVLAETLFACGTMIVFTGFIPFLVDMYIMDAGSALAAATSSRAIFGCVFPLFTSQMYHRLGIPGASCLFLAISVLLAPMPFVFKHYGYRLWPQYL